MGISVPDRRIFCQRKKNGRCCFRCVNRKEIDEFEEEDFLKEIISEIGIVKNNGLKIEEYETTICGKETFREIYREYERKRNEERKIDFDDMLLLCRDLFIKRPDILKKWQEKFRYILIDEFQDINQVQYDVIRMLAAPENNLFVVGDDDQSIMDFAGGFQTDVSVSEGLSRCKTASPGCKLPVFEKYCQKFSESDRKQRGYGLTKNPGMERKWGDTACTGSERSGGGSFLCGGTDRKTDGNRNFGRGNRSTLSCSHRCEGGCGSS